jgi:hypothetical protein
MAIQINHARISPIIVREQSRNVFHKSPEIFPPDLNWGSGKRDYKLRYGLLIYNWRV